MDFTLEELFNLTEDGLFCEHCEWPLVALGLPCIVCSKTVMGRSFRQSTLLQDPMHCVMADCDGDNEDADASYDPCVSVSPIKKTAKPRKMPSSRIVKLDDPVQVEVQAEFADLLMKRTTLSAKTAGSTARKYVRYQAMLFQAGVFACRDDFFEADARELAHAFYRKAALQKFEESASGVSVQKYFTNMVHGFDDYVKLVGQQKDDKYWDFVDSLID